MNTAQELLPFIFPEPWSSGDSNEHYQRCYPVFAKTLLLGCCEPEQVDVEGYINRLAWSFSDMLDSIALYSISEPADCYVQNSNSVTLLAQEQLTVHIENLRSLSTLRIAKEIAQSTFNHIVSKIERPEVMELVQRGIKDAAEVHRGMLEEFVDDNWLSLQEQSSASQFAGWCLSEFQGPEFDGEHLDANRCKGVLTFRNGKSLVGLFVSGRLVGKGTEKKGRRIVYKGDFKDGLYNGKGELRNLSSKTKHVGEFLRGKPHGMGIFSSEDVEYEGHFEDGKLHGKGSYTDANGDSYQGEWSYGRMHGHGSYTWANGSSYRGEWQKGKQHGRGEHTWSNGSRFVGTYEKGERIHGELFHDGHSFKGAITTKRNGIAAVRLIVSLEDGPEIGFVYSDGVLRYIG